MSQSTTLPVEAALPQLRAALREGLGAVLVAPPGAGKSTVAPLALLAEGWTAGRKILLLEPRRLAARAVATRMAQNLGEQVGATVGYRMRMDTRVGPATRLEVVTEGVLTRMLQQDPALEGVAAVLFDEFHERSLHADLGLALCLQAQETVAPQLRLLVMSATIDAAAVATLLGNAPTITAEGRMFPVTLHHVGKGLPVLPQGRTLSSRELEPIAAAVRVALDEAQGDVLVFLPGTPEIHRLRNLLEQTLHASVDMHLLYGDLDLAAQQRVLEPAATGRRKLILATNLAETSLTIPGVRAVVDAGLERRSLFDPSTGMARLETVRISQASSTQRAGRSGRTAPGTAWRMWGEGAQVTLAAQTPPEILSTDLAPLALELAVWGAREASDLKWLNPPPAASFRQARELLRRLEAIDDSGAVTRMGQAMAQTGLHPRLAHMLVRARGSEDETLAAQLAALLTERDLLRAAADPDLRTRLEILRGEARGVDPGSVARVRELARRYGARGPVTSGADAEAGRLLAWAWPDRVAQRRSGSGGQRYLLANGRGAEIPQVSTLGNAEYLVALDLDDAEGAVARIRLAAPLSRAQLESALGSQATESVETDADARTGALRSRRVRRLGALVLSEQRVETDPDQLQTALLAQLQRSGLDALPWGESSRRLLQRLRFVAAHSIAQFPAFDDASLLAEADTWLAPFLAGFQGLGKLPEPMLIEALLSRLTRAQRSTLDSWAPTHVVVPTGSRMAIDYEDANAPCIEVRMQEVFGLADTPRIAGGSVAITLKLLSPARRPMQITRDLAGFWRGSYADVRKDMRGRYPRHYWPENPLEAEPVRGLRPKR
ncbi:MAG: ATP-dependent helicase HrpB [Pseudomonadota bacterium]